MEQAKYDTSISKVNLSKYDAAFRSLADKQSLRLDYASLYRSILKQH